MESSDNGFEMRPLTVLNDETASIAIFSCSSILNESILLLDFLQIDVIHNN